VQTPPAEVHIDVELVSALLREQCPDRSTQPVVPAGSGFDNAMFRVGEHHAARLPRRALAVDLIVKEQRWLSALAPPLPLPIPVPEHAGVPGAGFPWPWSVVPWLPGRPADEAPLRPDQGPILAAFLRALHRPAPPHAPRNPVRGVPLAARAEIIEARLARVRFPLPAGLREVWRDALDAPPAGEPRWLHGDLHGRNLLADDGQLTAVVDWGDLAAGDPAGDLVSMWLLFDADARRDALAAYAPEPALLRRARGWGVFYVAFLGSLDDDPGFVRVAARLAQRLLED